MLPHGQTVRLIGCCDRFHFICLPFQQFLTLLILYEDTVNIEVITNFMDSTFSSIEIRKENPIPTETNDK